METSKVPSPLNKAEDELLASLLEELLKQSRKGNNNLEQLCRENPDLSQELREL